MNDWKKLLRELPAVDRIMREEAVEEALRQFPRRLVLQAVQETVAAYRCRITAMQEEGKGAAFPAEPEFSPTAAPGQSSQSSPPYPDLSPARLALEAAALAAVKATPGFKTLINATGIVIHTNLGRAPLAPAAAAAVQEAAASYSNLEFDLPSGRRGSRQTHLEGLLCELSGAEAALVVNNNAAAVFLVLQTLAAGREVVVSRGQLVEIGGSFRIPEIMALSGARLVEVGTTNKTYSRDYEAAVSEHSAAFLKVHTSNYHLVGFTATVDTAGLSALARRFNLLMIEDLGSGVFLDTEKYGLPPEPRVQDSLAAGADLVTFSGDKMLGGPQSGIILGRRDLVYRVRGNQLARTLRIDKLSIAALEATLRLYLDEERALQEIPVWRMLTAPPERIRQRAETLAARFSAFCGPQSVALTEGISRVGGGALPAAELPTCLVALRPGPGPLSPEKLAEKLRTGSPAVIARLQQDSLLFDPRTIFEDQEEALAGALKKAWTDQ